MNDLIVVGLGGVGGSGKTTVANIISPGYHIEYFTEDKKPIPIVWTKLSFAMPIKKIVNVLLQTLGVGAFSRQCYQVHDIIRDLIGASVDYDTLVDMVYEICSQEIPKDEKPRQFLQWIGTDFLRVADDAVFTKWMKRQITLEYNLFRKQVLETNTDGQQTLGIVIDDMRFENEIETINSFPKSLVVRLDVTPQEAQRRLWERDGHGMDTEAVTHPSERISEFSDDLFDVIINTNQLPAKLVAANVLQSIENVINPFQSMIFGVS